MKVSFWMFYRLHPNPTPFEMRLLRRMAEGVNVLDDYEGGRYQKYVKAALTRMWCRKLTKSIGGELTARAKRLVAESQCMSQRGGDRA